MTTAVPSVADGRRRRAARERELNGIDFVEVSDDQLTLTLAFLLPPPDLIPGNFRIDGPPGSRPVQVIAIKICRAEDLALDDCVEVVVDAPGDWSTYRLCLVEAGLDGRPTDRPLPGFDPRYRCVDVSFKVGCSTGLDCAPDDDCPPEPTTEPAISYLAKDYASFRQLILDRLALVMPSWTERHVPDLEITLIELLAYVGDYLSYAQDAVATEAYLETARRRSSVRRHARLVDHLMHDGCNARAWVTIETLADLEVPAADIALVAMGSGPVAGLADDLAALPHGSYEVYEPIDRDATITLRMAHGTIQLYTWTGSVTCLLVGATRATLVDAWRELPPPTDDRPRSPKGSTRKAAAETAPASRAAPTYRAAPMHQSAPTYPSERGRMLDLRPGDILIFEEIAGPETGVAADADPRHRQAVRLVAVRPDIDPVSEQPIVEVEWAVEDRLEFAFCISSLAGPECTEVVVGVVHGNVILVDHGSTGTSDLPPAPCPPPTLGPCIEVACDDHAAHALGNHAAVRFEPTIGPGPITRREMRPVGLRPAAWSLDQDPAAALPDLRLEPIATEYDNPTWWLPRHDLLGSRSTDRHFVAETDDEDVTHLRFGDGDCGARIGPGARLRAHLRRGNGVAGNVGPEAISRIVARTHRLPSITGVRNPLAARGGIDPETLGEARAAAPTDFRRQLRAVTGDDYAAFASQVGGVARAAGWLAWTGSWYEAAVAVDALGGTTSDALESAVARRLERFRRIGHDLDVKPARAIPIDLELCILVEADVIRAHVERAILGLLGSRALPDGRLGLFHPDRLTFGESIDVSSIVASVASIPGVRTAEVTKLERLFVGPDGELEDGRLTIGPLEIARLDNDRGAPQNGRLALITRGGR